MIHDALTKASAFSTRKVGDTPTDNNQLTPKGYVDAQDASVLSAASSIVGNIQESGLLIANLTGVNILNSSIITTTETSIVTGTLPASLLGAVDALRYKAFVSYTFANSAIPVLTVRFKLGSQTFATIGYATGDVTSRIFKGIIEGTVYNNSVLTAQSGVAKGTIQQDAAGTSVFTIGENNAQDITVDTGADQTVSITAEFSGNNRGTLTVNAADIQLLKRLIA